jgi:hypothetical protein
MDNARLERVLMRLARRYAPPLVTPGWEAPGDYPGRLSDLATALAGYDLFVTTCQPPAGADAAAIVTPWVETYVRLYDVLARAVFPSFRQVDAYYGDYEEPPIIVIKGEATPVIMMLAGFIAPYIAARQATRSVTDFELVGLMELILDELEAGDLPREALRQVRDEAAQQVRQLLSSPVQQLRMTAPKPALARSFDIADTGEIAIAPPVQPAPASIPEIPAVGAPATPPPPDRLPELDSLGAPATVPEESRPFGASIPIFFESKPRGRRPPPVPDLPDDLKPPGSS